MTDTFTHSPTAHVTAFAASPGWQIVIDPDADAVLDANTALCNHLDLPHHRLAETRASDLFHTSFNTLVLFTQELITKGASLNDDLVLSTPEGEVRVETSGCRHTSEAGTSLHLFMQPMEGVDSFRKQRDAEQHFRTGLNNWNRVTRVFQEFERENQMLLDAAGEGIYGVDRNGVTTFVNPAAQAILEYTADELLGKNMHTTVHHSHADGSHFTPAACPIIGTCREGVVKTVVDDVFWKKSGEAVEVEYTSTPMKEDGVIVGAVVVFRDVSQKKSDERKLLAALSEVERLKNRLEMEKAYLQEEISSTFNHHQIIGSSPALRRSIQQIELVGPTDATVLITGESGTGKELIARAIHQTSARSERPLIRVNCAAIPEDLFESEFFGHIKGSFTGATRDRAGRFELADGGTLFLDEVGEIPLHLQSKLLRVLQEQQFERIGGNTTRSVDVRLVAATNRDLRKLVDAGQFREDLYFRLNVFPIESIPLRKRRDDIPLLTKHFISRACTRAKRPDMQISMKGMRALQAYDWPGNIRELENVIERQVILSSGDVLSFDSLTIAQHDTPSSLEVDETFTIMTTDQLRELERRNIINALKKTGGKVAGDDGAAALLLTKPTTLASRIKKLQIDPKDMKPH